MTTTTSPPSSPLRNFFSGARAAVAKIECTATKLGEAAAKLEDEFVKLGDGIINPAQDPTAKVMESMRYHQRITREAFIREQHEIEQRIMKQIGRNRSQTPKQPTRVAQHESLQQTTADPLSQTAIAESRQQCMDIMKNHLESFLESNPGASFEAWLADLHPENVTVTEGDIDLDDRFYIPGNPWETAFAQATTAQPTTTLEQSSLTRVLSC